jgi:hypothetical protein
MIEGLGDLDWCLPASRRRAARRRVRMWERDGAAAFRDLSAALTHKQCLEDRAAFAREALHPDYDGEAVEARLARRAVNWTPTILHE